MSVTLLDNETINFNVIKAVRKIFPPAWVIKNKVVKDNRSHNHFCRARGGQVCDLRVHQGEPLTLLLVTLPHRPEEVAARSQHPQNLGDGRGVNLARGEAIAGHDHVVGTVIDRYGSQSINHGHNIILVDGLLPRLPKHPKASVQSIDAFVSMGSHLSPKKTSPSSKIK